MSGHSKWATIKRAKASTDAKRAAVFTKLGNLITIAAREKGGDLDSNFSLRMAIEKAKAANMPKDNIERAVKRGLGELGGDQVEELIYEGFGPAGIQAVVKCLTDNKNRSAASVRHIFSKAGGSLGAVMWNFSLQSVIRISKENLSEMSEQLELEIIEMGAEDIIKEEEGFSVQGKVEDLQKLEKFFEEKNISVESADLEYIAKEEQELSEEDKLKVENFVQELEECEDVSDYYFNVSI